jgi:hypothetical protein
VVDQLIDLVGFIKKDNLDPKFGRLVDIMVLLENKMKIKPKDIMVTVPAVHLFTHEGEDAVLASGFNTFVHGKVHMKYECLGTLGGQYVSIFYLQRNNEFSELREQFMSAILQEEESKHITKRLIEEE